MNLIQRIPVDSDNDRVKTAHNEQGGRFNLGQHCPGEVRTPTTRYDSADNLRAFHGRCQSRAGTSAGTEIAYREVLRICVLPEPVSSPNEAPDKQRYIEAEALTPSIHCLFISGQKVN